MPRGRPRGATRAAPAAKLDKRLVLNGWMLKLFEASSGDAILDLLKDREAEGIGEDGITNFHRRLAGHLGRKELPNELLLAYDENIVRHWRAITARPERAGHGLKHFQYLALLFTEVYLDRYFRDSAALLDGLNAYVDEWNTAAPGRAPGDQAEPFELADLNKLAFWMATGAGKTLLMHVNIKQYLHYLEKHGRRRELNRIILLTPNEGLSRQHLDELQRSGIDAEMFSKDGRGLFAGQAVEIIDIHKLAEDAKEKTVAVDSFEGNNLVLVDEGHRGSSTEVGTWMDRRRRLCEQGFSFEYSATFGQAIKPAQKTLIQEYGHCILFDYSYRYFHRDGYGKEFQVLNLKETRDEEQRLNYLTGCLLAFQQQLKVFRESDGEFAPYGIEKPLWIFVAATVTKGTSTGEVSDIVNILQFLDGFLREDDVAKRRIELIMRGTPGLQDTKGREIFANRFTTLFKDRTAQEVYKESLETIFNAPSGGALHIEQISGAEGEIALRAGQHEPFGVVNVGEPKKVVDQCRDKGLGTGDGQEFGGSLFHKINERDSAVNVLIGAKKFSEGWSSWRVSTMGLMNVGKSEGSEIIQLFGRGVRLKGWDFSLKRSTAITRDDGLDHPKLLQLAETLNVFGVKSEYMAAFKEYLEEEGLPGPDDMEEIILRVINRLEPGGPFSGVRLWTLKLQDGKDFKRDGPKPVLGSPAPDAITRSPVSLDWYPRIEANRSAGVRGADGDGLAKEEGCIGEHQRTFLDLDQIWFELERYKAEKAWFNLAIPRSAPGELLATSDWYRLFIPSNELVFNTFKQVRTWHEVAVALLKKYCDRFYKLKRSEWEAKFLEYRELQPDDGNFVAEYSFRVPDAETDIKAELEAIRSEMATGRMLDHRNGGLTALSFDRHLYTPLISLSATSSELSPGDARLNAGECDFVEAVRRYHQTNPTVLNGKELYLLRNRSRGKGLGFFEAGNFYPDFLLWVVDGAKQSIAFVDPKGLRNLEGKSDPKIELAKTIKDRERALGDKNIQLESFLWSETKYAQVQWNRREDRLSVEELERAHVLFPADNPSEAVGRLLAMLLSRGDSAA